MRKCPNCNHSIDGFHLDCPNCGYKLVSPQEAEDVMAKLDQFEDFVLKLDMSEAGIKKTIAYLENVSNFVKSYQDVFLLFLEEHTAVSEKREKLGDKLGSMKAQTYLGMMNLLWANSENQNFSLAIVASSLPGCFLIRQRLLALKDLTSTLLSDYSNFFNHKDRSGLEKSKKTIGEISQLIEAFWASFQEVIVEMRKSAS